MMRLAIQEARKNLVRPAGGPFGACIVRGTEVLAVARNTVLKNDATCHAEVNAIRSASRRLGFRELSISNRRMKTLGGSRLEIMSGFLREECLELLAAWSRLTGRPIY